MKNKISIFTLIFFLLNLLCFAGQSAEKENSIMLKNFKTDLCTSYPEGTRKEPRLWAHCCILHDMSYWVAGNKKDLKRADIFLKECVTKVAGAFQGSLMYLGIRAGHAFPIKSKYRWGWAWQKSRKRYARLSKLERDYVLSIIYDQGDISPDLLDEFIQFRFFELSD
jgi:hypothetical protein